MNNTVHPQDDVQVPVGDHGKILHFSDGVDEEIIEELHESSQCLPDEHVDTKTLTWPTWISHYAWKSGTKVLSAIDYAGEGLADFFGITTPKYQIEIDEYYRRQEEKKKIEEESAGWIPVSSSDIPLVNEPVRADHSKDALPNV